MKTRKKWEYDEMQQVGTDYEDPRQVEIYDRRMSKFRDIEKENAQTFHSVGLKNDHVVLEIGTGTGELAIGAARRCRRVYAVDVSPAMLKCAAAKARKRGVGNITFVHAGFLTYEHKGLPIDTVVSKAALHHLPDFWKMAALKRIHRILKPCGRLYLGDIVFDFPIESYQQGIDEWIGQFEKKTDSTMAASAALHVKKEYSTFDWIIDGMLRRTGFSIKRCIKTSFFASYLCVKR
ncbi:MAG: class I SAM-dependent methyltransferase [Verrucomicrobiae bacterium]|nr:class I SAM-dependent methyltransferase [Verrucomicrobiae bacterium]